MANLGTSDPSPPRAVSAWWGLAAVLVVSCVLRAQIADIPLERDEGEYGYIAQRWLAGELPYQSAFNQKFPGAFVAYAAVGAVLGESPAAVHWGLQLWSMGTITLIFLLGRKLFSAPAGVAAAAFSALMVGDYTVLGNSANTEMFAILFFAAAVLAAVAAVGRGSAGWAFAAGFLGAGGMSFKQPGLFNLAFVWLYVAWASPRRVRLASAAAAGAAAVLGLVFAYFAAHGAWGDFYDNTIGHNLAYASRVPLAEYPYFFWETFSNILASFWPVVALAAWGVIGPRVFVRSDPAVRANGVFVLVWLGFCGLAVCVGGYFRDHYFVQAIPAAALLAGLGATLVPVGRNRAAVAYALCAATAVYVVLMAPRYYLSGTPEEKCRWLYGRNPFPESRDIARLVAENTSPGDAVLVVGSEPQILYYARRRSATRYILAYPLMTAAPDAEARQKSVLEEVRRNDPKVVVTVFLPKSFFAAPGAPTTLFREVREYMAGRYEVAGAVREVGRAADGTAGFRFETGRRLDEEYRANPMWYDTPDPWATVLVWRRVEPR